MERKAKPGSAGYESIFREINEGIQRGQWPGEHHERVGFRCECARLGCNELVELTIDEYERIRKHSRRFLEAPGHEQLDIETVIEARSAYLVVEKRGQAGVLADKSDPRR